MAGALSRFSFTTAAENQFKQQKHCKKHCFLVVRKKWCLEKGITEEIENYEPTQLNTLLEQSNLGNNNSISSKVIRTQTEQFLELFSWTLNFFVP